MVVKYHLKVKRNKSIKKHFIEVKNLAGFITFYCALCPILVCSGIVRTYETLLTYDLGIRNTGPRLQLVSCYIKHFLSKMKNDVFYKRELTVLQILLLLQQ